MDGIPLPTVIQNSFWSWVAGSLLTSLNSSEEDVLGLFGGWEGRSFWSFVPSVRFFAAVCVDAVLLHLCAIIWGKGISFFAFHTCSYLVVLETLIRWMKQYCEISVQQIKNQDKHTHPKNQSQI